MIATWDNAFRWDDALLTWDGLVLGGGMSLDELLMSLEAIPRRKLTDKDWRGEDRHEKLVPGFWTRSLS